MKTKLGHIATIQTGIFAKPQAKGEVVYLQAKHFDEGGWLKTELYPDLKADNINKKHLLRPGDVLFAAKGANNFAACYESINQPAVASTSFFVLRIENDSIIPEYLAWLINHPVTQKYLKANALVSSIASISKTVLEELEISMPSIKIQRAILNISALRKIELSLKKQIEELQEQNIQHQLIKSTQL